MDLFKQATALLKDKSLPVLQRAKEYQRLHEAMVVEIQKLSFDYPKWSAANEELTLINGLARKVFIGPALNG